MIKISYWDWVACGRCEKWYEEWDRRPMWITASEIWTILHIIQKPYSIIISLFIQNISKFLATLAPRFLLAEVSHDEAKMRERRERPLLAGKAPRRWKRNRSVTPAPAPLGFLKRGSFFSWPFLGLEWDWSTVMCLFSVLEPLDSVLNFAKNFDEDGIRTHACRAHWISSPTP